MGLRTPQGDVKSLVFTQLGLLAIITRHGAATWRSPDKSLFHKEQRNGLC